jgi:hypothetical protein
MKYAHVFSLAEKKRHLSTSAGQERDSCGTQFDW